MAKEEQSMINYNKLKLAHELAEKITKTNINYRCDIVVSYEYEEAGPAFIIDINNNGEPEFWWSCDNIDSLIGKLQELTAPKPKYEAGQEVWFIDGDCKPSMANITGTDYNEQEEEYRYGLDNFEYADCSESELYLSREALINSQIDYWKKLKMQRISESNE